MRISGIWIDQAMRIGPAPSTRAASITSLGMLLSAPYITTIQPPAPVQKAMTARTNGRRSTCTAPTSESKPSALSRNATGLTVGSSTNSQSMTLDAPASAPGM